MRPTSVLFVAFVLTVLLAGAVAAAGVTLVTQRNRAFSVDTLQIATSEVVRFTNDDKFVHQIFVEATKLTFESEEQEPGTSVDIHFPTTGSFEVRCHIHPKMLLKVDVR